MVDEQKIAIWAMFLQTGWRAPFKQSGMMSIKKHFLWRRWFFGGRLRCMLCGFQADFRKNALRGGADGASHAGLQVLSTDLPLWDGAAGLGVAEGCSSASAEDPINVS